MRLFLDAHLSARRIARTLRERGHDVHAADEDRSLDGWTDERLLVLATGEGRIMVTCNVRDVARLARTWAEAGRSHSGCVLLVGIDHREFGLLAATRRGADAAGRRRGVA
ncbi:MAG: DUF5615 family PIN-like protein, partial [Candidatus Dormibacteraceae bacterium]